jgi:DNA-binding CsgD family transcriptional regulator
VPGVEDLRRQLRAMAVAALPLEDIWRRSDALLRRAVPWDVSAWGQVDPATLLSTGCLVLGMPFDGERERAVFQLEHDEREVGRLVDLVHRQPPAVGLDVATGGRPERSPRWAALLRPLGICDDVRVALVSDDGHCWASLYAYRRHDVFRAEEVMLLGALAGDLADAVRLALLRADAEAAAHPDAPGLLLLGPDGRLSAVSALAQEWLSLLAPDGRLPSAVTSLAAALRSPSPGPRTARVQLADGRWVALHASHLDDAGGALIVELARPLEVAEVLCAAYGLSPRERDVVGLVLRGESNRATARALSISEHTVKEHLKSVFTKVGVLSRGELAARLLHEHYLPRRNAGLPASAAGWFRESA